MHKMRSRFAGTCRNCGGAITPGTLIYWAPRGGAVHVDCQTAKNADSLCTTCGGSGSKWNNAPCPQCDGTGSRRVADRARSGGMDDAEQNAGLDATAERIQA